MEFHNALKIGLSLAITSMAFAGGINTNTNQSVLYLRQVARDASTDVDAPYANPSGTAFMEDGLYLSINHQTFFQSRSTTVNASPIFEEGTEFKGETFVPSMPSAFATWHHGSFAISGHFGIVGGGGTVQFNDGIPSFAALMHGPLKQIESTLTDKGLKTTSSSVDISLDANAYIFGATLGAAYEWNKMVSVYAGARFNYAMNSYEGSIGNLRLNSVIPGVNPDGKEMEASKLAEVFEGLAQNAKTEEERIQYASLAKTYSALNGQTSMEIDLEQTGWGITPIFGLGFQYKRLTVGAKLEYNTSIEMENDAKVNSSPLAEFNDGVKDHNDIPTLISVGLTYGVLDNARLSLGYHHWFDSKTNYKGDLEDYIDDTNEFLFGVEIDALKKLTLSGGFQVVRYGLSDEYLSDMNINLDATTVGFGFAYKATDWMRVNVAYFKSFYNDYEETVEYGVDTYSRESQGFGIGLDFRI